MKHISLFSGIGGFDLAAEWMGWENVAHCEWNPFGQKVLKYYWPNAISYHDITKTDFTIHRGNIDIITGGFPCQPYSLAGQRKGKEDERHLWPEMLRAIREIQPPWVVGENVLGLVNWSGGMVFDEVQADLEAQGYEVQAFLLPAVSVNADHRRDRIWIVAYNDSFRQNGRECKNEKLPSERRKHAQHDIEPIILHTDNANEQGQRIRPTRKGELNRSDSRVVGWSTRRCGILKSLIRRNDDGVSRKLDEDRLFALGNAIVPQVAHQIFKAIQQYESL